MKINEKKIGFIAYIVPELNQIIAVESDSEN